MPPLWSLFRPDDRQLRRFLEAQAAQSFSYMRAFSRPRSWPVRLGYPIARGLQRRFVLQSQAAMRRIVADTTGHGEPA